MPIPQTVAHKRVVKWPRNNFRFFSPTAQYSGNLCGMMALSASETPFT